MRKRERALWGKGTSGVLGPQDSFIYQQLCLCFQNIPSANIPLAFQYEQKERKTTNNYDRHTSKGMGKGERNKSVNRTTNNRITGGQFELWRMGGPHCWSDVLYTFWVMYLLRILLTDVLMVYLWKTFDGWGNNYMWLKLLALDTKHSQTCFLFRSSQY